MSVIKAIVVGLTILVLAVVSTLPNTAQASEHISVRVDIRPGVNPNLINPNSTGVIPVAILSTPDFDAPAQVDRTSLTFGRTQGKPSLISCNDDPVDVNGNGRLDLVCNFSAEIADFRADDTRGKLKGLTLDGTIIKGKNPIVITEPVTLLGNLDMDDGTLSMDHQPDDRAEGGVATITTSFTNTSDVDLLDVFFEVVALDGLACPCELLNADGGPGGVGSVINVGDVASGESVDVLFEIGLTLPLPFDFFVEPKGLEVQ